MYEWIRPITMGYGESRVTIRTGTIGDESGSDNSGAIGVG
jgi:hypothetical protein